MGEDRRDGRGCEGGTLKINAGCGAKILPGWVNIDIQPSPKAKRQPDILSDLRSIPLEDACADQLMAIHVFEHFAPWEVGYLLAEWRRLLKPGGILILEMPDVVKSARNLIDGLGDQMSMWGLYGDPGPRDPFNMHKWGWTFRTIEPVLLEAGFVEPTEGRPQFHPVGADRRDFRVTASKPLDIAPA